MVKKILLIGILVILLFLAISPIASASGIVHCLEIELAYRIAFDIPLEDDPFYWADSVYLEADEELIRQILRRDKTDLGWYIAEAYDCDDYTFRLMGVFHSNKQVAAMPIFITWVNTDEEIHAVLSYYKDRVKIIEPQTDEIFDVPDSWELILLVG